MLKLLAVIFCLLISGGFANGQSRDFDCEAQKLASSKAADLLEQSQQKYKNLSTLKAAFAQESYLAALSISETSEGSMMFAKPGEMRWEYKNPDPQTFLVKGHTVWLYQPEDKQLIIDSFDKMLLTDLPVSFLMGIGNLTKDFSLKSACKNKEGVVFELEPKKKEADQELKSFFMLINPDSALVKGGKVIDASGNVTSIVMEGIEANASFGKETFKPDFPSGIDVTDRRKELHG